VSFDTEVVKDGIGRAIRVDVSTDKFSTIEARWGNVAGLLDGTNMYSSRINSLGMVRRGFGQQRVATGGTTSLVLDNADGALDNYATYLSMSTLAKVRFRIYVVLFTPGSTPGDSKLLGEFSLSAWPERDNAAIRMELADDVMGAVGQQAVLPTLADWEAVGSAATNPLKNGFGRPDSLDGAGAVPVQLAFGEDWLLAMPHLLPIGTVDAAFENAMIVPLCCTRDTGAGSDDDCTNLRIDWLDPNTGVPRLVDVPRSVWDDVNRVDLEVWRVERSPTITKDSRNFKVIYLVVRADLGVLNPLNNWLTGGGNLANDSGGFNPTYDSPQFGLETAGGYPWTSLFKMRSYAGNNPALPQYANIGAAVLAWYVKGFPFSAMTQQADPVQHPVDVLTDLVSYYSASSTITVDSTAAARVKAGNPTAAAFGVVQPWTDRANNPAVFQPPPSLRQAITKIAQSSDIDVFINWSGQFSFSSDVRDFTVVTGALTAVELKEEQASDLKDRLPSNGERWAVFNRLFFTGGKAYPAEGREVPYQGPYDFEAGTTGISIADRIMEASLEQGWVAWRKQAQSPWFWRQIDIQARPVLRFRYNISALRLELGMYFRMSWTRGPSITSPYITTIFQCEAITYAPGDDSVEVEAVWRGDVEEENPYLLDDESLLVRSKGVLTGQALCDGSEVVEFDGTINLSTMSVAAGDILILRDSTQAADVFTRNAAFRIAVVLSTTQISVLDSAGDPAVIPSGNVANADWSIVRGFTTYHDAVSDPTNYPDGSLMYGKVTNEDGEFSDSNEGNLLLSG
jgi:hypothetical protein